MNEEQKAIVFNALTGQVLERELNEEEIAQREESNLASQTLLAELEAKQTARTSALAKLAALGLTEEEIAAL